LSSDCQTGANGAPFAVFALLGHHRHQRARPGELYRPHKYLTVTGV
jgi:hypothetical protein